MKSINIPFLINSELYFPKQFQKCAVEFLYGFFTIFLFIILPWLIFIIFLSLYFFLIYVDFPGVIFTQVHKDIIIFVSVCVPAFFPPHLFRLIFLEGMWSFLIKFHTQLSSFHFTLSACLLHYFTIFIVSQFVSVSEKGSVLPKCQKLFRDYAFHLSFF